MKYYAYIPTKENREPTGTFTRIVFELKTDIGAIKRAKRILGENIKLIRYTNPYNDATQIIVK